MTLNWNGSGWAGSVEFGIGNPGADYAFGIVCETGVLRLSMEGDCAIGDVGIKDPEPGWTCNPIYAEYYLEPERDCCDTNHGHIKVILSE